MAVRLPRGKDDKRCGEWWRDGNFFLKTTGSPLDRVAFNVFRERSGLSDCVPYDFRHLWCTWMGNHKVSFCQTCLYSLALLVVYSRTSFDPLHWSTWSHIVSLIFIPMFAVRGVGVLSCSPPILVLDSWSWYILVIIVLNLHHFKVLAWLSVNKNLVNFEFYMFETWHFE